MKTFHEVYNKSFPLKKGNTKGKENDWLNPWISKGIVQSSKHKF